MRSILWAMLFGILMVSQTSQARHGTKISKKRQFTWRRNFSKHSY
jgi:hypothetical protein